MRLHLKRKWYTAKSTVGELHIEDSLLPQPEMFILEDAVRRDPKPETPQNEAKIAGQTAIPEGTYQIVITFSNRFKRILPLLLAVPGYEGVRIHPGNDAGDTEGCLLPGMTRAENFVGASQIAFDKLYSKLKAEAESEITISDARQTVGVGLVEE